MTIVSISSKGQIILPKELLRDMGIDEATELELIRRGKELVIRPIAETAAPRRWRSWRGVLEGSEALGKHLAEHQREVVHERVP